MAKTAIPYADLPLNMYWMGFIVAQEARLEPTTCAEFATAVDARCRAAYESDQDNYFKKAARSRTNRGRDLMLHTWVPHWLESYKLDFQRFLKEVYGQA